MIVVYVILGVLVLFLLTLVIRALCFNPKAQPAVSEEAVNFDQEGAVLALQQLIRCKTISYNDKALEDEAEFQ